MTTAIILAGGMGTRLRCAVPDVPKPMAQVSGRPFLEHQMDYWINQGVDHFVISVGYMKEVIINYFGSNYRTIPLTYVIEDEPLGTGGGLLLAAQGINEPFLVLNGDTYFEVDLTRLLKFHAEQSSKWTFSLFRSNEVDRYMGMVVKGDGEIVSLKSGKGALGNLANGGVYLVDPSVVAKTDFPLNHRLSLEDDLLLSFRNQGGKLYGLEFSGVFIDIGVPEDYFRAAEVLPN